MSDQNPAEAPVAKAPKDRSPSFPFIGLPTAIERLTAFEAKFGRHPTPANKAGLAWEMKEASSQAAQTLAALKSFGMVDYNGAGPGRLTNITDEGRNYLRAQQDSVKRDIVRRFALTPKVIASYWQQWGAKRPIDAVCLDELVLNAKFTQSAAETFLRVYDSTVAYAGLVDSDMHSGPNDDTGDMGEKPIEVGDFVEVEVNGSLQFPAPVRVRAVQSHEGKPFVFVDGVVTGYPMESVTLDRKGDGENKVITPMLPLETRNARDERAGDGEEMDRFTVDEGVVKITFPSGMTPDSVDELEQFFQLFIKKAKRRAGQKFDL